MRRREFIAGLVGGLAAWPAARAQQPDRMRRIGALTSLDETDPEGQAYLSAFTQRLADLGWTEGRNLRMEGRWGGGDVGRILMFTEKFVGLQPGVILLVPASLPLRFPREAGAVPVVFFDGSRPGGSGVVRRLAGPGGKNYGFYQFEAALGGKWL